MVSDAWRYPQPKRLVPVVKDVDVFARAIPSIHS